MSSAVFRFTGAWTIGIWSPGSHNEKTSKQAVCSRRTGRPSFLFSSLAQCWIRPGTFGKCVLRASSPGPILADRGTCYRNRRAKAPASVGYFSRLQCVSRYSTKGYNIPIFWNRLFGWPVYAAGMLPKRHISNGGRPASWALTCCRVTNKDSVPQKQRMLSQINTRIGMSCGSRPAVNASRRLGDLSHLMLLCEAASLRGTSRSRSGGSDRP